MLTESGQSLTVPEEQLAGINLVTAVLAHPVHGRLTEFPLLAVNKNIALNGVRYVLSWRDGDLAFYRPIPSR